MRLTTVRGRCRPAISLLLAAGLVGAACGSGDQLASTAPPATVEPSDLLEAPTTEPIPTAQPTAAPSASADATVEPPAAPTPIALPPGAVELLTPEVLATYPHDITAYTQGFELYEGRLIESTGRAGHPGGDEVYGSDLRIVDVDTGEVLLTVDPPVDVFAEGVTRVGDELFQLTWQDEVAYVWDVETFELRREIAYQGQGWGICHDGDRLIMTDGSSNLYFRDPATFELIGQVQVTQQGFPVESLNELECVADRVWANVWRTDVVLRIDPESGFVDGVVDATGLEQPRTAPTEVLNGIAWDATSDTWLMTGKFWPTVYRVRFVTEGVIGG